MTFPRLSKAIAAAREDESGPVICAWAELLPAVPGEGPVFGGSLVRVLHRGLAAASEHVRARLLYSTMMGCLPCMT